MSDPEHAVQESPATGPPLSGSSAASTPAPAEAEPIPARLGRYEVRARLGAGGFGVVYRGYDAELGREVALKVPHRHRVSSPEDVEAFLTEARNLARLDHAGIVPVYDAGHTDNGLCYVVSKFVAGTDVAARLKKGRTAVAESVEIVARVAEALQHAHQRGLVHRDVKPANILLDMQGVPVVADFGLALRVEDFGKRATRAGTPAYMAPEQAWGESHRVDGRADVYSLGVVFYELLTSRRPFRDPDLMGLLEQIRSEDPQPPRQLDDGIPHELERICLKALSKRAADRYSSARDLADDLRHWQCSPQSAVSGQQERGRGGPAPGTEYCVLGTPDSSDARPVKVVPRGLRAYSAGDADFFLELLPGPRDRDGLPDGVAFWKHRIEATDPDETFAVGLLYGPSGCGKSSLVKAGLLPRLAGRVLSVYVEAADDTEVRLLRSLRSRCPALPADLDLADSLAALRQGRGVPSGGKVLLVLDQFEQWLHARREELGGPRAPELVQALRQCDGIHVLALVLVRDDFAMAASRFMRALEVSIVEGRNFATVDLFDPDHAYKVLGAFGRAYGRLPERQKDTTAEQERFLERAVVGLAQEGKVISVRLSLFAEMVKGKPWTPATLKAVGGTEGIGVTFLEEALGPRAANPEHRRHHKAAQAVLKALLTESGTDIKGHRRSRGELMAAAGYGPRDFPGLLRILDSELRLVTPVEAEEPGTSRGCQPPEEGEHPPGVDTLGSPAPALHYQLTHDYLVPAVRTWLTRRQRESARGRAELRLAERTAAWAARPQIRQLPAAWEWANIQMFTRRRDWTAPQRQMMRSASRYHGLRATVVLVVLALAGWGVWEVYGRVRAAHLVDTLLAAETADVPEVVGKLGPYRAWAEPLLRRKAADAAAGRKEQLHVHLALGDEASADYLAERLMKARPEEVPVICQAPHVGKLCNRFMAVLFNDEEPGDHRLRAACALARVEPDDPRWRDVAGDLVRQLAAENTRDLDRWAEALGGVRWALAPALVEQLLAADPARFGSLVILGRAYAAETAHLLHDHLDQPAPKDQAAREAFLKGQAQAAVALLRLDRPERVWPLLAFPKDGDPTLRTFLIHKFAALGADPHMLLRPVGEEPDDSIRRALLLALGEYDAGQWTAITRGQLTGWALGLYRLHDDPGVHSAADWLLRVRLGKGELLRQADEELREARPARRGWLTGAEGHVLAVIPEPGEFSMGPAPGEGQDYGPPGHERQHRRRIGRRYATATREVTVAQFQRFRREHRPSERYAPEADCPVNMVTWYDAAAYCNWLSGQEGLPQTEWCYPQEIKAGMKMPADYLKRTGYRLPTEAEWEYACRAGTGTARGCGSAEEMLDRYAWYSFNARDRMHPAGRLKPNDFGLFDMHGNASEWCQDAFTRYHAGQVTDDLEDKDDIKTFSESDKDIPKYRVLRGGSVHVVAVDQRSAVRSRMGPADRDLVAGFRVARTYRGSP